MNPLHDKKGWWHSDLLKFSNPDGTLTLLLKGDPAESKYPGKPKWCGIVVEGPDGQQSEHTLNVEPEVEPQIQGAPKDVWLKVRVKGGRGEKPGIFVEDDAGPVFAGDAPVYEKPVNKTQRYEVTPKGRSAVTAAEAAEDAVAVAVDVVMRFRKESILLEGEAVARIFNTLFIQMSR
jgi:hypothetical protein